MNDPILPTGLSPDPPRLDYESPQTRLSRRRSSPPERLGRLWAAAAVIFCGSIALHASHREGDIAEGIGATIIVVGLLLFLIEFVLVWWRGPG